MYNTVEFKYLEYAGGTCATRRSTPRDRTLAFILVIPRLYRRCIVCVFGKTKNVSVDYKAQFPVAHIFYTDLLLSQYCYIFV
jgi:hypothetical protein